MSDEIKTKKWTHEELFDHIRLNCKDYNSMVVVGMLYKKLYGMYPKIGMSGQQAAFLDSVLDKLPEAFEEEKKEEKVQSELDELIQELWMHIAMGRGKYKERLVEFKQQIIELVKKKVSQADRFYRNGISYGRLSQQLQKLDEL